MPSVHPSRGEYPAGASGPNPRRLLVSSRHLLGQALLAERFCAHLDASSEATVLCKAFTAGPSEKEAVAVEQCLQVNAVDT